MAYMKQVRDITENRKDFTLFSIKLESDGAHSIFITVIVLTL